MDQAKNNIDHIESLSHVQAHRRASFLLAHFLLARAGGK